MCLEKKILKVGQIKQIESYKHSHLVENFFLLNKILKNSKHLGPMSLQSRLPISTILRLIFSNLNCL